MIPHQEHPTVTLHTLISADGSATYTSATNSHTILSGVNYPLEVSYRSREIPESTYIEVNVRPQNAVAGVKEHHVEHLVTRVLQSIVRGEDTPRTMLQCTLQVTDVEVDESLPGGVKGGGQGESYLELLAGCVNAAVLGCLDAGVQMSGVVGAVLVAVRRDGEVVLWPGLSERKRCASLHVLGFGREGEMVLCESEGVFDMEVWEQVYTAARKAVVGREPDDGEDVVMDDSQQLGLGLMGNFRRAVEARVVKDSKWRAD